MTSVCFSRVGYSRWTWLVIANVAVVGVLGFYSTLGATPQAGQPPFANPVDQRADQIRELREIKELLKEQNELLKSGANKAPNAASAVKTSGLH
jgi:hypothetical protein